MKGKVYDKGLLLCVSHNMGHNRCDVIVENYFYDVDISDLEKAGENKCRK